MKALYSVTKNTGEDHDRAGVMCHSLEEKVLDPITGDPSPAAV